MESLTSGRRRPGLSGNQNYQGNQEQYVRKINVHFSLLSPKHEKSAREGWALMVELADARTD